MMPKGIIISNSKLILRDIFCRSSDGYSVSTEHSPSRTVDATNRQSTTMKPTNQVPAMTNGRRRLTLSWSYESGFC